MAAALVVIAISGAWPQESLGETAEFRFETFTWQSGVLNPRRVVLPIDFGHELAGIQDVRVSYAGVSHIGTGYCCGGMSGDCVDFECDAALMMQFTDEWTIGTIVALPGDEVEHSGTLELQRYGCVPYCGYYYPLGDDPWGFLLDGATTLWIEEADSTPCGSKCSAYVDLSLILVEIDYDADVPVHADSWGALKSRYVN